MGDVSDVVSFTLAEGSITAQVKYKDCRSSILGRRRIDDHRYSSSRRLISKTCLIWPFLSTDNSTLSSLQLAFTVSIA